MPKSKTRKSQKKSQNKPSDSGPSYGATIGKTNKRTPFVKICAVLALGLISDEESTEVLSNIAKDRTQNGKLRAACILALAQMPNSEVSRRTMEEVVLDEKLNKKDCG